ncbi:hypothetical protein VFPPC_18141 [Pochonia chlamydosporia 170]|uniref:Uncharacterized protein n=1 Tax=Pochonia chlamydosporia 170 TaxID=1380566 RepID=A0A219API2_METCM|nr:hypothetical protein VFPPC_18141 [Pochonia chlamydosporia 170]OWT42728.1 hypothetical protein VFPPC_18141 [Pochonia chlamydosporia 170]
MSMSVSVDSATFAVWSGQFNCRSAWRFEGSMVSACCPSQACSLGISGWSFRTLRRSRPVETRHHLPSIFSKRSGCVARPSAWGRVPEVQCQVPFTPCRQQFIIPRGRSEHMAKSRLISFASFSWPHRLRFLNALRRTE